MKYFKVNNKNTPGAPTTMSEVVFENLSKNKKVDLEKIEEVDANGRNEKEAKAFDKLMSKETRTKRKK